MIRKIYNFISKYIPKKTQSFTTDLVEDQIHYALPNIGFYKIMKVYVKDREIKKWNWKIQGNTLVLANSPVYTIEDGLKIFVEYK